MKTNQALVDLLGKIAAKKRATPAQISLMPKSRIVPIPGTTKLHRLVENIGAVSISLTSGDLREIEEAAAKIEVEGERYAPKQQAMVGRGATTVGTHV